MYIFGHLADRRNCSVMIHAKYLTKMQPTKYASLQKSPEGIDKKGGCEYNYSINYIIHSKII